MLEFFRVWGGLLAVPWNWKGVADVYKLIPPALLLAALSGMAAFWGMIPWWILPIAVLVTFYVSLTAGMAWVLSRGLSVSVGPVCLDEPVKLFYTRLEIGPVAAKVTGTVVKVVDSFGTSLIERSWEGHLRGRPPKFDKQLAAHTQADYGWVGVTTFASGNPTLFIYTREHAQNRIESGHGVITISRDVPLEQQGVTTLDLVMSCETYTGEKGSSVKFSFEIAPDPGSSVGYKIVQKG